MIPTKNREEYETAIRAIVRQVEDGWNAHDGDAFAAPFADDADYVIGNGAYVKGRSVIAAGHQRIFDSIYKGSHNTASIQSIRFLRSDVALVHVLWCLQFKQGARTAMNTMVISRDDERWRIAAFHNTPITSA